MQTQNIKKFTNLFLHYSFYIPIITFLALYVVRVFYLGQFHDDWDLFRAGNIKSFNDTLLQFHDRPIIGLLFYGVNIFWNGSPVILSCLSSLLVAITAVLLFRFLKSINSLIQGNYLAPSFITAFWLAIPWGLGYSLWPTGCLTLVAFCFFLIAANLIIAYINDGGIFKLLALSTFLALSFLTYQAWFLNYLPCIALIYILSPAHKYKNRNTLLSFLFCSIAQGAAILWTRQSSPKSFEINFGLLFNNFYYAPINAIKISFIDEWKYKIFLVLFFLLLIFSLICFLQSKYSISKIKIILAVMVSILGFIISTVPYSLANYGLHGLGVMSRTTIGINFWLCICAFLIIGIANNKKITSYLILILSSLILLILIVVSKNQIASWETSWARQNQILQSLPINKILTIPPAALILVDEPTKIQGIEVFATPWDINPAVDSHFKKLGILKTINHPEFFPIYKGVLWNEDGTVTFDWGDSRKDINQIWVFVPSQNKFERIFEKGEIKSRLFP